MKSKIHHQFDMKLADKQRLLFEFYVDPNGAEHVTLGRRDITGATSYIHYTYEEFIIMFTELATMMMTKEFASVMHSERYINAATEIQIGA